MIKIKVKGGNLKINKTNIETDTYKHTLTHMFADILSTDKGQGF